VFVDAVGDTLEFRHRFDPIMSKCNSVAQQAKQQATQADTSVQTIKPTSNTDRTQIDREN
jgi:hypothetical protein